MFAAWLGILKAGGVVSTMPILRAGEIATIVQCAQTSHAIVDSGRLADFQIAVATSPTLRSTLVYDGDAGTGEVGAPCPDRGMKVKAYAVVTRGREPGPALAEMFQDDVKTQIAPYRYPREIAFFDAVPKTATGKIQRFALRHSEIKP